MLLFLPFCHFSIPLTSLVVWSPHVLACYYAQVQVKINKEGVWFEVMYMYLLCGLLCIQFLCVIVNTNWWAKKKKKKQGRPRNKAVADSDKLLYSVIVSIGVLGTRYTENMHTGLLKTLPIRMHDIVGVARAEHGEFGFRHHCHKKVPPHATESQHRLACTPHDL